MLKGSCLCGGVKYQAEGPIRLVARCHCEQCRKASGAEFTTNGTVSAKGFRVLEGEALLKHFESSPGGQRVFCGNCGSPVWKRMLDHSDDIRLRLGCLDVEAEITPKAHIFVASKPKWSEITDSLPQFAREPE